MSLIDYLQRHIRVQGNHRTEGAEGGSSYWNLMGEFCEEGLLTGVMAFGSGIKPASPQRPRKKAFEGNRYPDLSPPSPPSLSGGQRLLEDRGHRSPLMESIEIGLLGHRVGGKGLSGSGRAKGSHLTH